MRENLFSGLTLDTDQDREVAHLQHVPKDGTAGDPRAWTGTLHAQDLPDGTLYYVAAEGGARSRFAEPRIQETDPWEAHRLVCCDATATWSADDLLDEFGSYAVSTPPFQSRQASIDPASGAAAIYRMTPDGQVREALTHLDRETLRECADDRRKMARIGDSDDHGARAVHMLRDQIAERVHRAADPEPEVTAPGGP